MTWTPYTGGARYQNGSRPQVGDVVAYGRSAWEVRDIRDADPTPEEQERLDHYVQPWRDRYQPYKISLRRLHGPKHKWENSATDLGLRTPVGYAGFMVYPNGRVPLCSCHQHPWPCLEADQQEQARRELERAERELRVLPGCCPACEEPVTSRQRSITFGGPNVRNPLAEGPTFHLRSKCYHGAARYEEVWVRDEPGRPRSLLTLSCAGTIIVHHDGSAECFGAVDSDCPSVFAKHHVYSACYHQSHGCGRGCSRAGHPGTHVSGAPADPRAVTRVDTR